jgi:hypothetical protein
MSVLIEKYRQRAVEDWIPAGGWVYEVKTAEDGPIAIEGLQDAVLRYFDGALDSSYSDCVVASRDDLIDAEPVWFQFVKAHVAAKSHTFTHEHVWVMGQSTAIRVTFIPVARVAETPTNQGQQNRQAQPQSIAEGLRFEGPVRTRGSWHWSSMRHSSSHSSGSIWSPMVPRSPVYEES